MRQLFTAVLSLSLSGTLTGLMIAVTHPVTGKYFSRKWNYYIWLLVVARLALPFHFFPAVWGGPDWQTDAGNFMEVPAVSADIAETETNTDNAQTPAQNIPDAGPEKVSGAKLPPAGFSAAGLLTIAAYLWFFGAVTALFVKLLHYCRFRTHLKKDCVRITDNRVTTLVHAFCAKLHIEKMPAVYKSASVSGPVTIGLWNPVIVMPEAFFTADAQEPPFQLVLHHELVHVARKDLLYKWIYQLLLCVHWFNPVLYYTGRQINSDCELACDEAILAQLTESGRQLYGNILIDTARLGVECRANALSTTLLENKKNLKKRLDNILHYQKTTHFRLALSICTLAVMLTVSACSTVWIASDDASASKSGKDYSDTATDASGSDESGFPFAQVLTSLVSRDAFLDSFASPDRSSDAWKIYDDDKLLAGDDIRDNWGAYNYCGGSQITASGFVLYGSDSFFILYADKDVDVTIKSSFDIREGKFKIIYTAPDNSITTLNETGAETTRTITMKEGRNVLKMAGQGAKLTSLEIRFPDLKESQFLNVYHSEEFEYAAQVKDAVITGEAVKKDKVVSALSCMDAKDASEVFNALLTAQTTLTDDELCDFFLYSDAELSSQYLLDAVREGAIQPPGADTIAELMPFLTGDCAAELLKSLPVEKFYDVFADNIWYLDDSHIEACLTDYLDRGGTLTYSMYDRLSPYLSEKNKRKLDNLLYE